ncbi:MAG: AAA family ATPase [Actinobacteria bacterium]|nr:AAA family ATPase [Actinomycetota bacterium]MSW25012.1 AAA family ATPase [Actinomycetota bacterium]MSX29230.1 AAA family ATPase [Actinomycetota bacterium]MSX43893.1 AAA family ATPase [Actinomycetota bacterium]MSX97095.1 AAA family ATPase [Actinomycetota bacterium]
MTDSLFDQDTGGSPLAVRMRPRTLDEFVGQRRAIAQGSPLHKLLQPGDTDTKSSVILWGPPGTGKTTLAQLIARAGSAKFMELSAINAGVKDVRDVISAAQDNKSLYGVSTVLFVDEVHRFNKTQQDALLPGVENGWVTLIAATTENPSFSVIAPLMSRSLLVTLSELDDTDVSSVISKAIIDPRGLNGAVTVNEEATQMLIRLAGGDARRALTVLEAAAGVALSNSHSEINVDDISAASDHNVVRYDKAGDQHYDIISAYIKSIRGSDPDAALHYLARMLEAGEDPRFIARRLMISASEDIGLADNSMLQLAVAAAQTVALIGMPEARITLSQATIALALAPKSNSAYLAIDNAIADIRQGDIGIVPAPLRDSHYARAGDLGHGIGYEYPHDAPGGIVAAQYLPDALKTTTYYRPTDRGTEAGLSALWRKIRTLLGRD